MKSTSWTLNQQYNRVHLLAIKVGLFNLFHAQMCIHINGQKYLWIMVLDVRIIPSQIMII